MRTLVPSSVRGSGLKIVLSSAFVLLFTAGALAGPEKAVRVSATGQIVSSDALLLTARRTVSGRAGDRDCHGTWSRQRRAVGARGFNFGHYTGTGVFTTADGSTISTEFEGQVIPNQDGTASFTETHTIVDGTGQYENSSGELILTGTGDALGHLDVSGTGTFTKG